MQGQEEYGKWLAEPPDYATDRPDLQADIPLASAGTDH